ncbi:MAG: Crossover junction endodeoxyribonuclease RuvC [Candidatus Gottesmanbacteria bacterium GW2011_GWA1_47_8]|uniref:Crossover junction endodeoxyribonuclease RuvC n=1 Tax=Candidatus Gottesmanbacteria bacterium GW2011_GWA1_47_8 TaxID=1618438 RepID=A0A0G1WF78_9BACT|nr:MAG: Crossover junction endodeoxyribonuclease RuvC [Candidatus Gottesmanbacteria bacterium GW2011_GWA1_47_8]
MIIFGVDPGTTRLGWGIIEKNSALAYGCITPQSKAPAVRLATIFKELYFAVNAKTVIPVAEARGVVLLSAAQENIPVISYTPLVVKQTITGSGRADKTQVQKMVKILLKLKEIPKPDDTADALAIAMTHAFTKQYV